MHEHAGHALLSLGLARSMCIVRIGAGKVSSMTKRSFSLGNHSIAILK